MFCDGYLSCSGVEIDSITSLQVNGLNALHGSIIYSDTYTPSKQTALDVKINGKNTISYQIHCTANSTCNIDCQSMNACKSLFLYCNGYCTINCDETNNIDCPFYTTGNYWIIKPTHQPTITPSIYPTMIPSLVPSNMPTYNPSLYPTMSPTNFPSFTLWIVF